MDPQSSSFAKNNKGARLFFMVAFLVCFVSAAIVSQIYSGIPPTKDHSPYDYFTGGALWMASVICLIMATTYMQVPWRMLFWLAGCMALALLAIDEFMAVHESTLKVVGDDDHSKAILWAGTPIGLYLITRVERAPLQIVGIFAVGFLFHTVYIATDVGDGDYFSLPFELTTLQWTEDTCELLFVCTYLLAFMIMLSDKCQAFVPAARPDTKKPDTVLSPLPQS